MNYSEAELIENHEYMKTDNFPPVIAGEIWLCGEAFASSKLKQLSLTESWKMGSNSLDENRQKNKVLEIMQLIALP